MVRQEYRTLKVVYSGGREERQALEYTGYILVRFWESGSSSTWNHIFDTRRCHWEIQISVRQKVCTFPDGHVRRCDNAGTGQQVFLDSMSGHGKDVTEMSNWSAENCGECGSVREGDISKMRAQLVEQFVAIMDLKTQEYHHLLKTDEQIIRVEVEEH